MRRSIPFLVVLLSFGCGSDNNGSNDGKGGSTGGGFQLGKTAVLVVSPDPISFGSVAINTTAKVVVTLSNATNPDQKGAGEVKLTSIALAKGGGDLTITQPEILVLQPGESTTLEVIYSPSDSNPDTNALVVNYHNAENPKTIPISTLQQVGKLRILPSPLEFGAVNGGESKTYGTRILNDGSDEVTIGSIVLGFETSPDFAASAPYAATNDDCAGLENSNSVVYPAVLSPGGDFICIDVSYTPFGGGPDLGQLLVYPPDDPEKTAVAHASAVMEGVEVGPELEIINAQTEEPDKTLNFGSVALGATNELSFLIVNTGTKPLTVDGVSKATQESDAFEAVEVVTNIAAGTVIPAKEDGNNKLEVKVRFSPQKPYPVEYVPLGFIKILSDDGDEGESFVTVFGQVGAPKLKLTPAEVVDFGVVGPNKFSNRTFTLTNEGAADLNIEFIKMGDNPTGEFSIDDDKGLGGGGVIPEKDFMPLTLKFTHGGGPPGPVFGTLLLKTNDPFGPTQVTLKAQRSDTLECKIELQPALLNYGTVPYGFEKTMIMNVTNVGTGACSWSYATVADIAFPEIFPGIGGCTPGNGSTNFEITVTPPAIKDYLKPGKSFPLEIKYVPEANIFTSIFEEDFLSFGGLVQVHLLDYNKDPINGAPVVFPEVPASGPFMPCNLKGKSGVANIAAIPGEIDFGLTTVGCHSQTHTVTIYNTGKAPLALCNIALDGCGPEFKLKNLPPIPPCQNGQGGKPLVQGQPVKVDVVYAPQNLGKDGCSLVVQSTDIDTPAVTIPLKGGGTFDDEQTDIFIQGSGQEVDVLFVVDNSGSMSGEQKSLSSNFDHFVNVATNWKTDYQVGVITTDMEEYNQKRAKLLGNPRYVQGNNVNNFKQNVKVGSNGSGTEQGLVAAQTALSLPLTMNPDPKTDCTNDASKCSKPSECVPAVDGSGKSYCGGWNMGFLRKNAALEIVFVSDEEDSSPAALDFYIDFFKTLKGFANENMFHAHAIVGNKGTGCNGPGGSAAAGNRYIDVANSTGGKFYSICDSNWAQKLADIGESAFGLKVQFFLTRPAIASTLKVTVAGNVCNNGWTFDAPSNSVIFNEGGACMPEEGQKIEIHYEVICYSK